MTDIRRAFLLPLVMTVVVAAPLAATAGETPAKPLTTLGECIALALRQNPDIISAEEDIDASVALAKQARGNYGPKVRLEAGAQVWNKPLDLSLASGDGSSQLPRPQDMTTADGQTLAGALQGIMSGFSTPIRARAQVTWSAGVTIAQPLAALWTIDEAYALRKLGIDVSKLQRDTRRRDVAYAVTEAYFRVIQAMRMEKVAAASVEQISAQVQRAQVFLKNGMVGQNDFLRAELGLAAAQQRLIQMRGSVELARGRLATLLGLSPDAPINPIEVVSQPPAAPSFNAEQAQEMALKDRIEFRTIAASIDMARHSVTLAKSKMIPSLNAVANYTHTEGSAFSQRDAAFVGGTLSWDVWEWGATYYGIDEAKTRVKQALTARSKTEDMIRLEAKAAYIALNTAADALQVARKAVTQAEENFRIEQKRYEAANNTSFDVLDAETQLTNARGQLEAALYEFVIADSNLQRAIGRIPEQLKVKS